jgi:PPK2 family polyphosphate:nucleotide phosphotransferase
VSPKAAATAADPTWGALRAELRVAPGSKVHLAKRDSSERPGAPGGRAAVEALLPELHARALALHDRLWAEARRSLLIVLQGIDTAGKDGTISHVFRGLNPQGTRVASFMQPSATELSHDFLWRVHQACPRRGEIGIFNRSHYEDVVVARVHELVPEATWRARYGHINAFESLLHDEGTTMVKFFLQISKDEQRERLEDRINEPDKRWKVSQSDLDERGRWGDYLVANDEMLSRTSTDLAPWWIIPADHKWYRNWAVSSIVVAALEALDPQYPPAPPLDSLHLD